MRLDCQVSKHQTSSTYQTFNSLKKLSAKIPDDEGTHKYTDIYSKWLDDYRVDDCREGKTRVGKWHDDYTRVGEYWERKNENSFEGLQAIGWLSKEKADQRLKNHAGNSL